MRGACAGSVCGSQRAAGPAAQCRPPSSRSPCIVQCSAEAPPSCNRRQAAAAAASLLAAAAWPAARPAAAAAAAAAEAADPSSLSNAEFYSAYPYVRPSDILPYLRDAARPGDADSVRARRPCCPLARPLARRSPCTLPSAAAAACPRWWGRSTAGPAADALLCLAGAGRHRRLCGALPHVQVRAGRAPCCGATRLLSRRELHLHPAAARSPANIMPFDALNHPLLAGAAPRRAPSPARAAACTRGRVPCSRHLLPAQVRPREGRDPGAPGGAPAPGPRPGAGHLHGVSWVPARTTTAWRSAAAGAAAAAMVDGGGTRPAACERHPQNPPVCSG